MESTNEAETFKDMYLEYTNTEACLYNNSALVAPEVLKAIIQEDLKKLMDLVESGASLNVSDYFGNGPFHVAIAKDNVSIVDYLLTKTKYLDGHNFLGETPLFKSISCRKYDLAKKLILAGADVNIPNNSCVTALHYAVTVPEVAHLLIKHGANVNAANLINQTPLHLAVEKGCFESVYMLLYYNADANYHDWKDCTPFMRAIEARNIEMQEVLIEYVADFNDTREDDWTVLGMAILEESPFVEEIIKRGGDVNNVNDYENGAIFLSLQYPRLANRELNLRVFKLIWDNIEYQILPPSRSIFGDIFLVNSSQFEGVLDIIIESDNFSQAAESVCYSDDMHMFIYKYAEAGLSLEKLTRIFCMLLTHGYIPNNYDVSIVFNHYGYCELYQIFLYMDIRIITDDKSWLGFSEKIPTRLMYDVKYNLHELMEKLTFVLDEEIYPTDDSFGLVFVRLLDYFVYPKITNAYLNLNRTNCVTLKIKALPKVPSLVELARNATRDYIIDSFGIKSSCELYTVINHLDISRVYKKILTFETILYKPTFTMKEFEDYVQMIDNCKIIRQITNPLIKAARVNANII